MAMENPFEGKEIWFGVGSQDLYGEEALRQVAQQTGEMVDFLQQRPARSRPRSCSSRP